MVGKKTLILAFVLFPVLAFAAGVGISTWTLLSERPSMSDWIGITDVSAHADGVSKRVSFANFIRPTVVSKSTDATLTDDEMDGIVLVTATATITLPAVEVGQSVCIFSTTAAAVHVDVNANDRIKLEGSNLDDADKITSASEAGNFVCLAGESTDGWSTLGLGGVWTDGGAT